MLLLDGRPITFHTFPNGETRVSNDDLPSRGSQSPVITLKYQSDADIYQLALVRDLVGDDVKLELPYAPYSRMDRAVPGHPFSLAAFARFINSLQFASVSVWEPHSDATLVLIERSEPVWSSYALLSLALKRIDFRAYDTVVFPDAGARSRYERWMVGPNRLVLPDGRAVRVVTMSKVRNFETGRIESLTVDDPAALLDYFSPTQAVIVDDLCSYGGTFLLAEKELRKFCAFDYGVHLVVTHLEDAAFEGKLLEGNAITSVHTTNSISRQLTHPKVRTYSQDDWAPYA